MFSPAASMTAVYDADAGAADGPLKSLSRGHLALFDGAPIRARIAAEGRFTAARYAGASGRSAFGIQFRAVGAKMNGAVGENRTHDLSLTKGLRYHYATTALVVFSDLIRPTLKPKFGQGCAAIT
jgi:hypothetical protein